MNRYRWRTWPTLTIALPLAALIGAALLGGH